MIALELVCAAIVAIYVAARLVPVGAGERRAFLARFAALALAAFVGEDSVIRVYGYYAYARTWSVWVDKVPVVIVLVWPVVIDSAAAARRLIDAMASPRIKIVFDAANLFEVASADTRRDIVARGLDLLADRVALAHAKDRNADGSFATAGKGILDYPHYLAALRRNGFDGPLVTHGLSAAETPGVAEFLNATLAAL